MKGMLAVSIMLVLAACGADNGGDFVDEAPAAAPTDGSDSRSLDDFPLYVADANALPTCDAAAEGRLVFVKSENAFKACTASKWETVEIKGEKGESGASGTDNRIASSLICGGEIGTTGYWLSYEVDTLQSGDVFVSGSVRGGAIQIGSSTFYSKGQEGAAIGALLFQFDVLGASNAGFWEITTSAGRAEASIRYSDSDATGGEQTWTKGSADCTLRTM